MNNARRAKVNCGCGSMVGEVAFQIDMISMISKGAHMAQLLVRNLDDELVRHLKKRAGEHGVSVEEEHRRILREALLVDPEERKSFWQVLGEMPDVGGDDLFGRDRKLPGRRTEQTLFED
jgi:antitoxin FitA